MDLATVLTSGVVAGLVAGLVALRTAERKIAIENITQQRQLWRDKVRGKAIGKAIEVVKAYAENDGTYLNELYVEFQLILNPEDKDDKSILDTIGDMQKKSENSNLSIVLSEKLALLLKHDWERAKREAKPVRFLFSKLKRKSYEEFEYKRNISSLQASAPE